VRHRTKTSHQGAVVVETRIGTVVAGYQLESLLGRGGMSVVYIARHMRLDRRVALKLLAPVLAEDASFRERFVQESQRAADIEHPHIVPIYDAGEADGLLYIAMRYVEGPDLKVLINREGHLPIGRTLFILEQVASALDAAHDRNLVHRDVKPANILVEEPADHVYLTDFGVVKHTTSQGLTKTGFFVGTADYAAPEQIEGQTLDARTDVYALGCVLYECLTGKTPFEREAEVAVMHAHLIETPPKVSAVRPDLPKALDNVIARALAKSKEERFDTCEDLIGAARKAVLGHQRPSEAARLDGPAPSPTAVEAPGTAPATPVETVTAAAATRLQETDAGAPTAAEPPLSPPTQAETPPPAAAESPLPLAAEPPPAPPPPPPPPSPPAASTPTARKGMPRWALLVVTAVAAAVAAAVVAVLIGRGDSESDAAETVPPAETTPAPPAESEPGETEAPPAETEATPPTTDEPPATTEPEPPVTTEPTPPRLESLVPSDLLADCQIDSPPIEGTLESAVCLPSADSPVRVHPDSWEVAIYETDDAMTQAYADLLTSVQQDVDLVEDQGRCTGTRWGGEGAWEHGPDKPGGRRFCYFDGEDAVLVWYHQSVGIDGSTQTDHAGTLGQARIGNIAHDTLFTWWRFWVHRIGKAIAQ
jgi:serine/threonine-protein kinase